MDKVLLVMTNVSDAETAERIAQEIIQKNLAACVNVLPQMRSVYRWNGRTEVASEVALWIKTTQGKYAALEKMIVSLHPYELPEIIALPVHAGLPAYLQWVNKEIESA